MVFSGHSPDKTNANGQVNGQYGQMAECVERQHTQRTHTAREEREGEEGEQQAEKAQPNNIENNFQALKCSLEVVLLLLLLLLFHVCAGPFWLALGISKLDFDLLARRLLFYGYKFSKLALIDNRLIYLGHVRHT